MVIDRDEAFRRRTVFFRTLSNLEVKIFKSAVSRSPDYRSLQFLVLDGIQYTTSVGCSTLSIVNHTRDQPEECKVPVICTQHGEVVGKRPPPSHRFYWMCDTLQSTLRIACYQGESIHWLHTSIHRLPQAAFRYVNHPVDPDGDASWKQTFVCPSRGDKFIHIYEKKLWGPSFTFRVFRQDQLLTTVTAPKLFAYESPSGILLLYSSVPNSVFYLLDITQPKPRMRRVHLAYHLLTKRDDWIIAATASKTSWFLPLDPDRIFGNSIKQEAEEYPPLVPVAGPRLHAFEEFLPFTTQGDMLFTFLSQKLEVWSLLTGRLLLSYRVAEASDTGDYDLSVFQNQVMIHCYKDNTNELIKVTFIEKR